MENFFQEWWPVIIPCLLAVAKLANRVTKHWPQWGPYLKWLGLVVEVLDIVRIPEVFKRDSKQQAQVHSRPSEVLAGPPGDPEEPKDFTKVRDQQ